MKNSYRFLFVLLGFMVTYPVLLGMPSQNDQPKRSWFKRYCCCCCSGEYADQYRVAPLPTTETPVETVPAADQAAESAPSIMVLPSVDPARAATADSVASLPVDESFIERVDLAGQNSVVVPTIVVSGAAEPAPLPDTATATVVSDGGQFLTVVNSAMDTPDSGAMAAETASRGSASASGVQLGDVRYRSDFDRYAGETRLHNAILRRMEDQILTILNDGELRNIYLNSRDLLGRTPLHVAVLIKDLPLVQQLVRLGAHVNICDDDRRTVLHYAVDDRNEAMLVFLLSQTKIDITIKDRWHQRAEELACSSLVKKLFDEYRERVRSQKASVAGAAHSST